MAKFSFHADPDEIEKLKKRLPDSEISWVQFLLNEIDGTGDADHCVHLSDDEIDTIGRALRVAENWDDDDAAIREYQRLAREIGDQVT